MQHWYCSERQSTECDMFWWRVDESIILQRISVRSVTYDVVGSVAVLLTFARCSNTDSTTCFTLPKKSTHQTPPPWTVIENTHPLVIQSHPTPLLLPLWLFILIVLTLLPLSHIATSLLLLPFHLLVVLIPVANASLCMVPDSLAWPLVWLPWMYIRTMRGAL